MEPKTRGSFGARIYALLLYLYPTSFRREYGDSMLQLFEDQRRAVRGGGGYAMLWWKTLRDLVVSVPAAHSNDASRAPSSGAPFVWTAVAILATVFVVNALILPSLIGRLPTDETTAVAAAPMVGSTATYLAAAQLAAGVVSTLLAISAFRFALRQRSVLTGAATFVAGFGLTLMALAMNPWLWLPLDRYPAAMAWALGVWPLLAFAWLALTARRHWRRTRGA